MSDDYKSLQEIVEESMQAPVPVYRGIDRSTIDPAERVNHPPHYNRHPSGVECVDIIEHMSFNVGTAVKYLWRADEKGAIMEDLRKALWYVQREIQRRGG